MYSLQLEDKRAREGTETKNEREIKRRGKEKLRRTR